ncbi:MAG: hypothetical protein SGCHY_005637 [Lobulomycetales sp.]
MPDESIELQSLSPSTAASDMFVVNPQPLGLYRKRAAYSNYSTIDWLYDTARDRAQERALRLLPGLNGIVKRQRELLNDWFVICLIGIITGLLAGFIDISAEWLADIREGYCLAGFYLNKKHCCWDVDGEDDCPDFRHWGQTTTIPNFNYLQAYLVYIFFSVCFAGCSALLVRNYAPFAAGSGIPEVKTILGGFIMEHFLGAWTLVIKVVGLSLSVASGLALGKEGPLVHVAVCVGNLVQNLFAGSSIASQAKLRQVLSAACAAGVSVAFGAPVGGVLFSLEEVSYYFADSTMFRSFVCAMIAALSLQLVNPFRTGKLVLFAVNFDRNWQIFEFPVFMLLGILGGLGGAFFIRMNLRMAKKRQSTRLIHWPIHEVLAVSAVTAVVSYVIPFLRVNSGELVANLFRECEEIEGYYYGICDSSLTRSTVSILLFSALVKLVFMIFTFGIRVPVVGGLVGRAVGICMQLLQKRFPRSLLFSSCLVPDRCVTPGTYAIVGAASMLAGVTRMTVSLTVIMFELTVLPIMVAVMLAKWIGDKIEHESIYDGLIHLKQYPFLDPREDFIGKNNLAKDIMTSADVLDVIDISKPNSIRDMRKFLEDCKFKGYPIVSSADEMGLLGYIGREDLLLALKKKPAALPESTICVFSDEISAYTDENTLDLSEYTDQTPYTIVPQFPSELVNEVFRKLGFRICFVAYDGHLLGLLTKKDLCRMSNH